MTGCVLILGASSAIAYASAKEFAANGYNLILAGRDQDELQRGANDIGTRYEVSVSTSHFDALDLESHEEYFTNIVKSNPDLTGILFAIGYLADQTQINQNIALNVRVIDVNYTSAASILSLAANHLESRQSGFIIAISSVAGDRGRQSNYSYGASKGALSLFLQGLRNRLARANVRVITIKPGFVDTQMTWGLAGMFLVASPDQVGKRIARSIDKRSDIIYTPWFWRYIMLVIKYIPEFIFKKMKL